MSAQGEDTIGWPFDVRSETLSERRFFDPKARCFHPVLDFMTPEHAKKQYDEFGAENLMLEINRLSVPSTYAEVEEARAATHGLVDFYVFRNLWVAVSKIPVAQIASKDDEMMFSLRVAFWTLYVDSTEHPFDRPDPGKTFDRAAHDAALNSFRDTFVIKVAGLLSRFGKTSVLVAFVCYARSMFECREFQAPPRNSLQAATDDVLGRGHLWKEYMTLWGMEGCCRI